MTKRRQQIATTIVAVLVIAATGSIAGYASQETETTTTEATTINSCQTIDEPGHYVLASDIENSSANVCIDIQSSDVQLDGDGHTIDGTVNRTRFMEILQANPLNPPNTHLGIGVGVNDTTSISNVTITNVTTTNWVAGILSEGASEVFVHGVTAQATGTGISMQGGNDSLVATSNTSNNYLIGVSIRASPSPASPSMNNSVVNVTANQNGQTGVGVLWTSENVARNITATGNGFQGLHIRGAPNASVEDVVVADSNFSLNGYYGVIVENTTNVTIADIAVAGTQGTPPALLPSAPPIPSSGILAINANDTDFTNIDARNQAAWSYFAVANATSTVQNLETDAGSISFSARNIGLGPTTTAPVNATAPNTRTLGDGLIVLNTSANAFFNRLDQPETTTAMDKAANETTTTAEMVRPVA